MTHKFGIVSYPDSRNKGDEIQSIAASKLLDNVDYLIPRNGINTFESDHNENVKLLCNGWFTTDLKAWPPSKCIDPLFISFHVTKDNGSYDELISEKYASYFKQYEPIGCRDQDTMNKFKKIGIDAYFSGCMTLTLENPYGPDVKREEILLVDPFYKFNYDKSYINYCLDILIPDKYKNKVSHITQWRDNSEKISIEDKIKDSEKLLNRYAKAKLVITSRIHCALPCLAMGTPVWFVDMGYDVEAKRDRFKGILDLFNTIDGSHFPMSKNKLIYYPFRKLGLYKLLKPKNSKIPIDWENPLPNPTRHLSLRENIKEVVKAFIGKQ